LLQKHADVLRFVRLLNSRRSLRTVEQEQNRLSLNELIAQANKAWHGVELDRPDWGDQSHAIAFSAELRQEKLRLHLILNAYFEPLEFELPPLIDREDNPWRRRIDT